MANLQAIGVDGLTPVFLWATGTGTDIDPYKSNFYAYQGGDWAIAVNNFPSGFDVGNFPLTFAATQSGNWSVSVDNFPATVAVTGTFWQATQPVSFGSLPAGSNVIGNIGNTTFDIGNFPSTQAITASSLPLPTGASTASNQSTIIGHVDGIEGLLTTIDADTSLLSSTITSSKIQVDVKTAPTITVSDGGGSLTIDGTVELGSATLTAINGGGTTEITNDVGNPIPVSASSLPLPTGASTSAKQDTGNSSLSSIDGKLPSNLTVTSTRLLVDGSGVTQPISGTVTANTGLSQPLTDAQLRAAAVPVSGDFYPATQPVSLSSLPSLATGSNTIGAISNTGFNATQSGLWNVSVNNFPSSVEIANDSGNPIPVSGTVTANTGLSQPLTDIQLRASAVPVSGTFWQTTQPVSFGSLPAGSNVIGNIGNTSFDIGNYSTLVTALESARLQAEVVNNVSVIGDLTLGQDLATETTLLGVDNKIPTGLTVTSTRLLVDGSGVTQPISGTVTANTGLSQPLTDAQLRATAVPVSGTFWQATQPVSFGSLPAGSNVIGNIGNTTFNIGNFPSTQAITASSLPLPTGASTSAKQDTGNSSLSSIDGKLPSNLTVTSTRLLVDGSGVTQPISGTVTANTGLSQPLTDAQLRAAAVPVSGDFYPATQPVSLSSLPSLATGSNTIGAISNTGFNATQSGLWDVSVNNFPSSVEIANDSGNPIPVSGTVTANTGLSQPLTNTELRASDVGVAVSNFPSTQAVSLASLPSLAEGTNAIGSITNTSFGISGTLPAFTSIPSFKIDQTTPGTTNRVDIGNDGTVAISGSVAVTGTFYQATQPVSLTELPALASGSNTIGSIGNTAFGISGTLPAFAATPTFNIGTIGAIATETTLSGLNTKIPSGLTVSSTRLLVDGSGVTQPVSLDISSLATTANQSTTNTRLGDVTEVAPITDTASSGLNGRLQRIAQRLTSLIGLFPTSLGAKTKDVSFPVTLSTDGVASGISTQIGEVQTSPTANTIQDRLKVANTSLQLLDDVIATDKSTALTKLSQVGGVDVFGLAHNFATTNAGELQVVQANGATDMFGTQRVGSQFNQIDIQFYRSAVVSDLVNVVTPTGTGYANIVDGGLVIGTGTGANGFQRVNSYNTTTYRSGSEEYCYFTLMLTATTNVNSFQRIIFGDVNNGFAIGYNGTTFGVFSRYKTVDTPYTISQFNLDKLDGSANSGFTRAGVPEAIDPTKLNVFRIRFGWVGGAPDIFEVLSPDGRWIAFHILRHPNFYTRASLPNADLPITAEVSKTSGDAVDLKLTSFCWGAGITGDPMVKGLTPITLSVTNAVQTVKSGGGLLYGYQIYNPGNNTAYVHLYDTGAVITIGTTASKFSLGNGTSDNIPVMFPAPIVFNNSIKIGASTAISNSTAPNQPQNVTLFYQ